MICDDIESFAAILPRSGALAGLDLGTKTIGVAVSDGLRSVASPITVIRREKFTLDAQALLKIAADRALVGLVLGLPRNMDGSSGPMVDKVKAFGRQLAERKPELVLEYWDERLTTAAAQRVLVDADMSRSRRRKVVDKVAASLILQGYMDLRARRASSVPT